MKSQTKSSIVLKIFAILSLLFLAAQLQAQVVYTIKADSVKLTGCDSSELIIENHTQNVPGFLFNTGRGRTIFQRGARKLSDSAWLIGADTLSVPAALLASNGLNLTGDTIQLGGSLSKDTKIITNNNDYWLRTPFNATENYTKTGQVFIGDSNYIQRWKVSGTGEYAQNSSLVVAKAKENNNENVELVTLTTADAPGKNGWFFFDYTNSSGLVQPRMETYSNGGNTIFSAFEHDVIGKAQTGVLYLINCADYDSLDLDGKYAATSTDLFCISNNYTPGFYINNAFDVGIGKIPVNGIRLDVAGKASFTDTLSLAARASYTTNIHGTYTPLALIDKKYSDSMGTTLHYSHTILVPTGQTISLIDNQYNIINPSASMDSLTLTLPSSPQNNDVVVIKFTKAISTVGYSGGTVATVITSAQAGSIWTLTYDTATSTWY